MNNSSKTFFLFIFLLCLSFGLIYKGIQEEFSSSRNIVQVSPIPLESPQKEVLGDQIVESSSTANLEQEGFLVTKVIDGDTIEVLINNQKVRVRLIGVDTPETVDPNRPNGCFGKEASEITKQLLTGKKVFLEKDVSETDRYGRLLRYVYLPTEEGKRIFVNDYLIRQGFGMVLTYPPDVKFSDQFLKAQQSAKEQNLGLWAVCE